MRDGQARQLADYVKSLNDFIHYESYDGNYNHIGATVADAVLQKGHNYELQVRPRIQRIRKEYNAAITSSEAIELVKEIGAARFLNWSNNENTDCLRFASILFLLKGNSVETEHDLKLWLQDDYNVKILKTIRNIGPKTADYFKILVGIPTVAIDRHLKDFLMMANIYDRSYDDMHEIITSAAILLDKDIAKFDHSIWKYMSIRAATKNRNSNTGCS